MKLAASSRIVEAEKNTVLTVLTELGDVFSLHEVASASGARSVRAFELGYGAPRPLVLVWSQGTAAPLVFETKQGVRRVRALELSTREGRRASP